MPTTAETDRPRRTRSPQVNITLTPAEAAAFDAMRTQWTEPGSLEPRRETLGRTIKRLALTAMLAEQAGQ